MTLMSSPKRKFTNYFFVYNDAFSKNDLDLGYTTVTEHEIDTGDFKPIKLPPRRVPLTYAEAELQLKIWKSKGSLGNLTLPEHLP